MGTGKSLKDNVFPIIITFMLTVFLAISSFFMAKSLSNEKRIESLEKQYLEASWNQNFSKDSMAKLENRFDVIQADLIEIKQQIIKLQK